MAFSADRRKGATNYPSLGPDDYLSDELPDYSSRRSSFYGIDTKPTPLDPELDRNRKASTASNMLEVPRYSLYQRQNSMGSTSSLMSNTSNNTFSYRNLTKPKIKNAFGGLIVLIGLSLLVLGIMFLIFGHTTGSGLSNRDQNSVPKLDYNNNNTIINSDNNRSNGTNNTTEKTTTSIISSNHSSNDLNEDKSNGYHVSAIETIGYFALFSGILLILIGLSVICMSVKDVKKPNPNPNPDIPFGRRVSTIEVEPQNMSNEVTVTKPEIMITTDNLKERVTYKKYPEPQPFQGPRASMSSDDPFGQNDYQKKFPF